MPFGCDGDFSGDEFSLRKLGVAGVAVKICTSESSMAAWEILRVRPETFWHPARSRASAILPDQV